MKAWPPNIMTDEDGSMIELAREVKEAPKGLTNRSILIAML